MIFVRLVTFSSSTVLKEFTRKALDISGLDTTTPTNFAPGFASGRFERPYESIDCCEEFRDLLADLPARSAQGLSNCQGTAANERSERQSKDSSINQS